MKEKFMKISLFFLLLILSHCSEIPLKISFDSPASIWEETFPLGNGRLGAMPDGGILKENIVLNEETMWSGCEWDPSNSEAQKWLPKIRQKLLEGDNIEAERLTKIHFTCSGGGGTNPQYGNYQTLGSFKLDYSKMNFNAQSVSEYNRFLSLNDALSQTSFNFEYDGKKAKFIREYFVSIPNNVIVIYLKTENAPLQFDFTLSRQERAEVQNEELMSKMKGMLNSGNEGKEGVKYYSEAKINKINENEVIILISAETDYKKIINKEEHNNYDTIISNVKDYLSKASELNYDELKENHIKEY